MTQSLAESGRALLEALGGNITKRPRTLSETVTEINKLTDEADRLARELHAIPIIGPMEGLLHRMGVILRDTHTAISTATASLSDDLKKQLGIKVTT
jgi:hypothetical protein